MNSEVMFLGETLEFWQELRSRLEKSPDSMTLKELLREVVALRGKVDFYETRIRQMSGVMTEGK